MQDQSLFEALSRPVSKEILLEFVKHDPYRFGEALELTTSDHRPQNWRSCWILYHIMESNDPRVRPKVDELISAIPGKQEGHQRELIKLVSKMQLNEEQEGVFFDTCLTIWESVKVIPSLRMMAFRFLMSMLPKYPEIVSELNYLVQPEYLEPLSPGIRNAVEKAFRIASKNIKS